MYRYPLKLLTSGGAPHLGEGGRVLGRRLGTLALTFAALLWWYLDVTAGREIANLKTLEFLAH